ncbi:DUF1415 domain-containing protein [Thalassotalea sediminis]|uniref:DUF1415 domain-containing protein n=1 Tax=Thalassotalea sediminis TaxID=1759089 RepID=UPI0025723E35|nr:DUF1415 domain-containing protein [Thalassotalea sediminis]
MNKLTAQQAVNMTRQWLEQVVIGLNFCPFAKKEFINNTIQFHVCQSSKFTATLEEFIQQVEKLAEKSDIETTLFILSTGFDDFDAYLSLVDYANDLLVECGYEGVFQIATFHPDYLFDGEDESSASHYTNRSPLPILHILREESLAKAIASYKTPEKIPENNVMLANEKGTSFFEQTLASIYKQTKDNIK